MMRRGCTNLGGINFAILTFAERQILARNDAPELSGLLRQLSYFLLLGDEGF
jgi:hypothetical protein